MHEGPGKRETCPIKAQHLDAQAPGLHLQGTRSTAPLRPDRSCAKTYPEISYIYRCLHLKQFFFLHLGAV